MRRVIVSPYVPVPLRESTRMAGSSLMTGSLIDIVNTSWSASPRARAASIAASRPSSSRTAARRAAKSLRTVSRSPAPRASSRAPTSASPNPSETRWPIVTPRPIWSKV